MRSIRTHFSICLLLACGDVPVPPTEGTSQIRNREIAFRVNDHPVYLDVFQGQMDGLVDELQIEFQRDRLIETDCIDEASRQTCIDGIDTEIEAFLRDVATDTRNELALVELVY